MPSELTHPITYALTICRALWEFANDCVNDGEWPKPMAAVMSGRASAAALRLRRFLAASLCPTGDCTHTLRHVMAELETISCLADVVATQDMTSRNTALIAMVVQCRAYQTTTRLRQIDQALDL